jgi:hypothetical protein
MLDAYCEWLNRWGESDPDTPRYDPRQFLVHSPEDNLYGSGQIHAIVATGISSAFGRVIVEASVTDGDEGGGTDLTAWFDLDTSNGTNPMVAMVQGFDTDLQFIFNAHQFVNLPD